MNFKIVTEGDAYTWQAVRVDGSIFTSETVYKTAELAQEAAEVYHAQYIVAKTSPERTVVSEFTLDDEVIEG